MGGGECGTGPEVALPILIAAMNSPNAESLDAIDHVMEFLAPWQTNPPDCNWGNVFDCGNDSGPMRLFSGDR